MGTKAPTSRPVEATATSRPSAQPLSDEDKAKSALSLAKSYAGAGKYSVARQKLQKILTDYPETKTASEAKKMLDDIAGK